MRKEKADRLKAEVKTLEELTDNLEIQMEMKGEEKIFETNVLKYDREKIDEEKFRIGGSERVQKKVE